MASGGITRGVRTLEVRRGSVERIRSVEHLLDGLYDAACPFSWPIRARCRLRRRDGVARDLLACEAKW